MSSAFFLVFFLLTCLCGLDRLEPGNSALEVDKQALQRERDDLEGRIIESASRDFNAKLL
jgi:hypothetical protein